MKKVNEYVKKVNIYIKNYKMTSNRNINKESNKPKQRKIYKGNKYMDMCIKVYRNIYIKI